MFKNRLPAYANNWIFSKFPNRIIFESFINKCGSSKSSQIQNKSWQDLESCHDFVPGICFSSFFAYNSPFIRYNTKCTKAQF